MRSAERATRAGHPGSYITLCAHLGLWRTMLLWNALVWAVKTFYWIFTHLIWTRSLHCSKISLIKLNGFFLNTTSRSSPFYISIYFFLSSVFHSIHCFSLFSLFQSLLWSTLQMLLLAVKENKFGRMQNCSSRTTDPVHLPSLHPKTGEHRHVLTFPLS